jgi:hypothetical protein
LVEVWVFGFIFLDELDQLKSGSFSLLEIELAVKVFAVDFEVIVVFLLSLDFALGFDLFKDEMPEKWIFGEGLLELQEAGDIGLHFGMQLLVWVFLSSIDTRHDQ